MGGVRKGGDWESDQAVKAQRERERESKGGREIGEERERGSVYVSNFGKHRKKQSWEQTFLSLAASFWTFSHFTRDGG